MKESIGFIGLGRLGLSMALLLEAQGYPIHGYDADEGRRLALRNRSVETDEEGVSERLMCAQRWHMHEKLDTLLSAELPYLMVAVPTTSTRTDQYDHRHINAIVEAMERHGRVTHSPTLVVISTTQPGYGASLAQRLTALGYQYMYHPEFIAQGDIIARLQYPSFLLIGTDAQRNHWQLERILRSICLNVAPLYQMDWTSAELAKLALNSFLTIKIAFANGIGDVARTAGADAEAILAVLRQDPRIGPHGLQYGYGYGGPCLPRDNQTLATWAQQYEHKMPLCTAADQANTEHLAHQIQEFLAMYKPEKEIVFESISYKAKTDGLTDSQPLALALALARHGRRIRIRERKQVVVQLQARYANLFSYEIRQDTQTPVLSQPV